MLRADTPSIFRIEMQANTAKRMDIVPTTVSRGIDTKYKSVPQIRLQGAWLENNCGFEPGTNIKVLCEEERLVIERC